MKNLNHWMIVSAAVLVLAGCATSKSERTLNEKISQENTATAPALRAQVDEAFSSPSLTESERTQLKEIRDRLVRENKKISEERYKLEAVLVKDLLNKSVASNEVSLVRKKLAKLDSQKLNALMNSIAEAQAVLGLNRSELNQTYWDFFQGRGSAREN